MTCNCWCDGRNGCRSWKREWLQCGKMKSRRTSGESLRPRFRSREAVPVARDVDETILVPAERCALARRVIRETERHVIAAQAVTIIPSDEVDAAFAVGGVAEHVVDAYSAIQLFT